MKKIKKIIILLLIIIFSIGGFLAFREYRGVRAEQQYGSCTIECSKEYYNNRESLESDESYRSCLGICGDAYEKITGKEITPLYERLKEEWQLNATP